ncbi:MAG: hypothetical protein RIR26_2434, partial [Pseudomonadota bacterium]
MTAHERVFSSGGNWSEVESLLDCWFETGETRASILPFDGKKISVASARLAGRIFKRGSKGIQNTATGHVEMLAPPSPLTAANFSSSATAVSHHSTLSEWLASSPAWLNEETFVLFDARVAELHPSLPAFFMARSIPFHTVTCSEDKKNLSAIRTLLAHLKRSPQCVVAVGGGVCCDMAGFLGGLLECPVHLLPTTLLAMVDAGFGGKTGVNHHSAGKNQIGLFVHLNSVTLVREFLTTLPATLVRQGLGEILKHAWLAGCFDRWQEPLSWLTLNSEKIEPAHPHLKVLLEENIAFKQSVVGIDPDEKDIRVLLNFGHTVAHLLEALPEVLRKSGTVPHVPAPIPHGLAVAIGMRTFLRSGWLPPADPSFLSALDNIIHP